jgi:hypothetical protein
VKKITGLLLALAVLCLIGGCGGGGGGGGGSDSEITGPSASQCASRSVVPWVDGAWTQPVPAWGSPVRLSLPIPLNVFAMNQMGAFGSHQGGHPEGLDHVWIQSTNWTQSGTTTTIQSMAAGTVTIIESNSDAAGGYSVSIDYGQGLIGKHMEILNPMVKVGDSVNEGDPIGQGYSITGEYTLQDTNRCDGELSQVGGYSYVSPFDYLKPDVQAALVTSYQTQIAVPYFSAGLSYGTTNPWEPYLTNPILFHSQNPGTIVGEWMLANKGWNPEDPMYYDKFTVMDVTNQYGHFLQYAAAEGATPALPGGPTGCSQGTWSLPDNSGKVLFVDQFGGAYCYGIYQVDENQSGPAGSTSKLTLEWSTTGYPAQFSANAAVYYARLPVYAGLNATLLGR